MILTSMPLAVLMCTYCILSVVSSIMELTTIGFGAQLIKKAFLSVAPREEWIYIFISVWGPWLHYLGNKIIWWFSVVCWEPIGNDYVFVKSGNDLCWTRLCFCHYEGEAAKAVLSMSSSFGPVYEKLNSGNYERKTDQWCPLLGCVRGETTVLCYRCGLAVFVMRDTWQV